METLAKILKELRIENNLSLNKLAEEIGVTDTAIMNWENNKNEPKAIYLKRLAERFNVTTDFLLGLEDEQGNKIQLHPTKPTPAKIPFRINAARSKENKFRDTVIYLTQEQYDEIIKICEKESDELDF